MKFLVLTAFAMILAAQQPPKEAGDDQRGYTDTPRLPGQKWRVHDAERPHPVKVTPGLPLLNENPPSDAIVLFDGKDLSQWIATARGGARRSPDGK